MTPPFSNALKQLDHSDPWVRIRALKELGHLKAAECLTDITRVIDKDPHDDVKVEAVRVLGQIQDIHAGSVLLPILKTEDIPMVMEAVVALGTLGAHGFTDGVVPLERLLTHSHFTVRKYAIEALGKCGNSGTIDLLYTHFKKEDVSVETRQLVATAIGHIGGSKAIQILQNLVLPTGEINELQMEVRRAAIYALGEARTPVALEVLGKVYRNKKEHKVVRKYTEDALKKTIEGAKQHFLAIKKRAEDILKGRT